jgi:hypothetical protein
MSTENVELIERMLEQAKHDPTCLWDILDDEVEWELGDLDIPEAGATNWHGPSGVREFFRLWVSPFDEWGYDVGEPMPTRSESA